MNNKKATSYRLSPEAHTIIKELADAQGVPQHAILEMGVRALRLRQRLTDMLTEVSKEDGEYTRIIVRLPDKTLEDLLWLGEKWGMKHTDETVEELIKREVALQSLQIGMNGGNSV